MTFHLVSFRVGEQERKWLYLFLEAVQFLREGSFSFPLQHASPLASFWEQSGAGRLIAFVSSQGLLAYHSTSTRLIYTVCFHSIL